MKAQNVPKSVHGLLDQFVDVMAVELPDELLICPNGYSSKFSL